MANITQINGLLINAATASYTVSASYAATAGTLLGSVTSASYAGTASYVNPLAQKVQITGSLNITGSTLQVGNNILLGNTTLSGSIIISGALGQPNPTISVFGDLNQTGYTRYLPVTTNIDNSISASYIYVSGSTNDLYFTQNGSGYGNTTRLRWLEGNLYTGLLSGGVLSTTPGTTTFNLSSGSGIIVTLNASTGSSDPYPTVQYLRWNTFTGQAVTNIATSKITYVSVNSAGTINQSTTPIGYADPTQWDNQIELGVILHLSGSVTTGVYNAPQVAYGQSQRTDDFIRAFGPVKVSGHTLQASGSSPTLSLKKTSGVSYNNGSNYVTNPNHPSTVSDPAIDVSKIYRYYISGSTPIIDTGVANAGYTAIDSKNYVDTTTGTLTAVGAGFFSIQRVFWIPNSPTNAFIVYYGNARYGNLVDATNAKDSEPFSEAPNTAQNAVFIGYIIVQGGGVGAVPRDLLNPNEATIIQGGLFRNIGGVGVSGTSPAASTLAGLTDVSIGTKSTGDLLFFSGSLWYNTKTLSGSYTITGSLNISGSITGSLFGTASWATNALTASYVNPLTQNVIITGSTFISSSNATQLQVGNNLLFVSNSGNIGINTTGSDAFLFIKNTGDVSGGNKTSMFEHRFGVNALTQTQRYGVIVRSADQNMALGITNQTYNTMLQGYNYSTNAYGGISLNPLGGSVSIGRNLAGTTDDSAKFAVRGRGATNATIATLIENTNGSASLVVLDNGYVGINTSSAQFNLDVSGSGRFTNGLTVTSSLIAPTITFVSSSLTGSVIRLDNTFSDLNTTSTSTNTSVREKSPLLRIYGTYTTGSIGGSSFYQTIHAAWINPTFNPTNNNATNQFNAITLEPVYTNINVTGSAMRGLYVISPSHPNFRTVEWDTSAGYGWGLYGVGTAPNYLNGNLSIGTLSTASALNVAGNAVITNGLTLTGSLITSGSVIRNTDGLNRLARYGTALSGSTIGTGVTAQTIVYSQLIPANTFSAGNIFRTYFRFRKLLTNSNATYNIIINTSNAVAGATTLATFTANTVHNQIKRDFYIAQGNTTSGVGSGVSVATDDTNNTQTLSTITWSSDQYLIYTVTLGTTDNGYGLGYTIEQVI